MNIDPGLVIVIVAVLIFYLRLIVLQRQRAKQIAPKPAATGGKKKAKSQPEPQPVRYSIVTTNRRDRMIGVAGAIAILVGILLNIGLLPFPLAQTYWWVPTAAGIVAFSWLFSL
jgi:hypothetical protein